MRARSAIVMLACLSGAALAGDPKPTPVDIKAFRDKLVIYEDSQGGLYVVDPIGDDTRIWYGNDGKAVYEQTIISRSSNGETGAWSIGVWAPRLSGLTPALVARSDDGTFQRWCDNESIPLKVVAADRVKQLLGKLTFSSSAIVRRAHLFARDDRAVYYYVDMLSKKHGGAGYRLFAGKKGAMKELALVDVASDSGGEVYSTKTGDMRFVIDKDDHAKDLAYWVKGDKKQQLVLLDVDTNSHVIWRELGIYGFLGTPCDEL
jgi:hypothetical protein